MMKYFLPGMGADSNMYMGPWRELKDCCFIDWPTYENETSLSEIAHKLIKQYDFDKDDIIVGSSMGGMVGLEIAQATGIKQVFLIGSAIHPDELSLLSKSSIPFISRSVVKISQYLAAFNKAGIFQTYAKVNPDSIVAMSKAILNWTGYMGNMISVSRIHGRYDPIIKCPNNCTVIKRGGHLIPVTHAKECVDFVLTHIN